ncbi:MAG: phosphate butyryltransferase [Deltaproteobacteria bacterium]|jgi:phosphate butyryltransferase|nr:phosphate butyryltransferase [Deltaproteobacteria bacterium]
MKFSQVVEKVKSSTPKTLAVAVAQDLDVLEAVTAAKAAGIASPVLVGDEAEINAIAKQAGLDLSGIKIINQPDMQLAVKEAVTLVGTGQADALMKGLVGTADLLRGVLNKEWGLSTGKTISYVGIVESERWGRLLFITDPAIVTYPELPTKVDLINNAVKVARALGVEKPKVACLAAVEVVNPKMPATMDATALAKMCDRGQIKNCIVDGPLALDNALSPESAKHKKLVSPVAGTADVLLVPNIESGNILFKAATYLGACETAGVTMGAKAPIIITSRADTSKVKFNSIACALAVAGN